MKINITKLKCTNCDHVWSPQQETVTQCPSCKAVLERHEPEIIKPEGEGIGASQTKK